MLTQLFRSVSVVALLLSVAACNEDATAPQPLPGATLAITPPAAVVYEADAVVLAAVLRDANGNVVANAPITWTVQDTLRAELGANGYLTALKAGVVKISATSGQVSATYDLTIVRPAVLAVTVLLQAPSIGRGDVMPIGVRADGPGGRLVLGRLVTLSSDNPNIVSIDASGRARALAVGTATIRATADGVSGTAQVVVTANDVQLDLSRYNGGRLPLLVGADSVMWSGVKEYHELYAETGYFRLSGQLQLRYNFQVRVVEYNVVTTNGQRRFELRVIHNETDRGLVAYDARGDLQLTSEIFYPLSHTVIPVGGGMDMRYRIPGTDEHLQLTFRRTPE